ncbi:MAG: 3'-5' exonuclease [Marinifilaceae bacterium]|jgi:DNA polymerase-3 subunit epsilon|nr:3'-5' exonuclease [Marinifilaceae bacterium]
MDFIAIDFETANSKRDSACAIGVVKVVDSKIIYKKSYLINPPDSYFHPMNVSIHGISLNDVENELSFNFIWEEIEDLFIDQTIVAHNASFDISVLRACLKTYGIRKPELTYACTVNISRKLWPAMPNHKLNTMASMFNIELDHHNALDDALACAQIMLKAADVTDTNTTKDLLSSLDLNEKIL